ncbi:MAG: F0F1 ATP synthase subunit B [Spirochaetes bacterium]|nr:F0F1 ATP synthase subunit B [Spirochaetota bacterium]
MDLFKVDPGLFILTIITFLAVLVVLRLTAWKPIIAGIDARADKIRDDLAAAEKAKEEAKQSLEDYKKKLEEGRHEARIIIEQARTEANHLREQMLSETTAQLEDHRKKALIEIEKAKADAVIAVRNELADVSTMIAGKILERELSPDKNRTLIDGFVNKLKN